MNITTYLQYAHMLTCKAAYLPSTIIAMVRNAGQLPEPFWLGVACGGGSRSAARCAART